MKKQEDTKPKNQQKIHKKDSSYGGYGGNSNNNMNGAINEFDDNLSVDLSNDATDVNETLSETNRLDRTTDADSNSAENSDLNKERADGFDRTKKNNKKLESNKKGD
jgi:hypothetical protein